MKLFKIITFFIVTLFCSNVPIAAMDICPRNAQGAVNLSALRTDNNMDYNCKYTPAEMRANLHKIMLCEGIVDNTNYLENCEPIFQNSSGKTIVLTPDETGQLTDGPISLPEGTYTHAVLLVENFIDSKFVETFSAPLQGDNGIGTTCWSNGKPAAVSYADSNGNADYTQFSSTCGAASDANPAFSRYTYKGLWVGNGFSNFAPGLNVYGPPNKNVYVMSDYSTLAVLQPGADPSFEPDLVSNGRYLLGVTQLSEPAIITPNTQNIDLGFLIKNAYFQKITTNNNYYGARLCSETHGTIGQSSVTGAHACLATSYNLGITFKFEVE